MTADEIVDAGGVAGLLREPPSMEAVLDDAVLRGRLRLKVAIGTANYTALLAETITDDQSDACVYAAKRFAVAAWYRSQQAATGSHGIRMSVQIGDGTETFASAETVGAMARMHESDAVQMLRDVGLYQEVTPASGTKIMPEDEVDD